jgi:hypothetical protein
VRWQSVSAMWQVKGENGLVGRDNCTDLDKVKLRPLTAEMCSVSLHYI